jgi:hypothetical protein
MTKHETINQTDKAQPVAGLALLRVAFPPHQISKLPKATKAQTEALKAAMDRKDFSVGVRCKSCGQWHHKDVVHLDYVGHAALTDRLLDCDPLWNWEPVAVAQSGVPSLDENGGMWIRLTVCGVTRLGYGHADGNKGGDALKEVIGDALRNAAMRFGAALDLWHKGELHVEGAPEERRQEPRAVSADDEMAEFAAAITSACLSLEMAEDVAALNAVWKGLRKDVQADAKVIKAGKDRKAELSKITPDEIPY